MLLPNMKKRIFAILLVLNAIVVVLEIQGAPLYDATIQITSAFLLIFVLEWILLVIAYGWAYYWKSQRRRMESISLIICLILLPLCLVEGIDSDETKTGRVRVLRLLIVARCIPTLRLLSFVREYTVFARASLVILPRGYQMLKVRRYCYDKNLLDPELCVSTPFPIFNSGSVCGQLRLRCNRNGILWRTCIL